MHLVGIFLLIFLLCTPSDTFAAEETPSIFTESRCMQGITLPGKPTPLVPNEPLTVPFVNIPLPDFECDAVQDGISLSQARPGTDITGLLEGLESGTYVLPAGTFQGKDIDLRDGVRLYGQDPESTVIRLPSGSYSSRRNQTHIYLMDLTGARNVTLGCLTLDANKAGQTLHNNITSPAPGFFRGPGGENGGWHAIQANGSRDVLLANLIVANAGTDGMNIGRGATNVGVVNTVFNGNRRQGVSVKKVANLHFKNSIFANTSGQKPEAGVDIEANSPSESSQNITFQDCHFLSNAGAGLMVDQHGANLSGMLIDKSEFKGARGVEIKGRIEGGAGVFTNIIISNNTIQGNSILGGSGNAAGGGKHINTTMEGNRTGGRILITKAAGGSSFRLLNNDLPAGDRSIIVERNDGSVSVERTGNH